MSFYSTWLHLPFRYSPGFVSLSLLVSQLGQSLLVVDLESTAVSSVEYLHMALKAM